MQGDGIDSLDGLQLPLFEVEDLDRKRSWPHRLGEWVQGHLPFLSPAPDDASAD
ncbi:MAG: hypothetical protein KC910_16540 [Candidatus Eremiobacteraeota bacterium]|nr:hypothetical protein [Candidatus Eremiobacteraeota bacterium]